MNDKGEKYRERTQETPVPARPKTRQKPRIAGGME